MINQEIEQLKRQIQVTAQELEQMFQGAVLPDPFPRYLGEYTFFFIFTSQKTHPELLASFARQFKNIVNEIRMVKDAQKTVDEGINAVNKIFLKMEDEQASHLTTQVMTYGFLYGAGILACISILGAAVVALTPLALFAVAVVAIAALYGMFLRMSNDYEKLSQYNSLEKINTMIKSDNSTKLLTFFKPDSKGNTEVTESVQLYPSAYAT